VRKRREGSEGLSHKEDKEDEKERGNVTGEGAPEPRAREGGL